MLLTIVMKQIYTSLELFCDLSRQIWINQKPSALDWPVTICFDSFIFKKIIF